MPANYCKKIHMLHTKEEVRVFLSMYANIEQGLQMQINYGTTCDALDPAL